MRMIGYATALATALAAASALSAPMAIKFASPSPPTAHLNVQIFAPWTEEVTAASDGALEIQLVAGHILASHRNVFDRVRKNVAAIGWGLQALVPGQFPASSVAEVPGLFETSVESSLALWRLLEQGTLGNEYGDVKPLAIFSFPASSIHAKEPLRTLDDLTGRKFAVSGKVPGEVIVALGGVPISLAPPEFYQSISRGLVNGVLMPWTGVAPYRMHEVTGHSLDGPLGGYPGMIIMNKAIYAELPAAAKKAIDSHSGETLVRRFATFWDRIQLRARKQLGHGENHSTVSPEGAEKARMIAALAAVERAWVARTPNGAKIIEAFKAEVAQARSGG